MERLCIYLLLFGIIVQQSCSSEEFCTDDMQAEVNTGFYSTTSDSVVTFYRLSVRGIGSDSLINTDTTGVSKIYLPLSNSSDTSSFIFKFNISTGTDTIWVTDTVDIFYLRELRLVSTACGFTNDYKLQSIQSTGRVIDEIIIDYPFVTVSELENVRFKVLKVYHP